MYRRYTPLGSLLLAFSLALVISACHDAPSAPNARIQEPVIRKNEQSIVGSYAIPIPASNLAQNGSVSLHPTGIIVEGNTSVVYRITGGIVLTTNSAAQQCGSSGSPPAPIVYAGGVNRGFEIALRAGVQVQSQYGMSNWVSFHQSPSDITTWESDTVYIPTGYGGELWVTRSGISGGCSIIGGGGTQAFPQFLFDGSQTLTVTKYQTRLELKASPSFGAPGTVVTFTPQAIGGGNVNVHEWKWKPLGGTAVIVSSCPTGLNAVCNLTINETGVMTVKAEVNGRVEIANRRVDIVPCATGDSLLDRKNVRDSLIALVAASNPDSAPGTGKRKERGGLIYRTGSGEFFFYETSDPSATECHFAPTSPQPPPRPGLTVVAVVHTHPSKKGEQVYGCRPDQYGRKWAQVIGDGLPVPRKDDEAKSGGGSEGDWESADEFEVPVYTITKSGFAFRLDPGVAPNNRKNNQNRYTFKGNSNPTCNW